MTPSIPKWARIAGLVLHCLVAAAMLFAGSMKVSGNFPADKVAEMGLTDWIRIIGIGEVTTAVLLVIPRTTSLGILLASSFWGGAICLHMSKNQSIVLVSALLVLAWLGAFLRNPAILSSFFPRPATTQKISEPAMN